MEERNELSMEDIDERKEIAFQMRKENTDEKLHIYVNSHNQIVFEQEIENCETIFSYMNIMRNFKSFHSRFMPRYESTFEMWMNKTPTIYCTYERD